MGEEAPATSAKMSTGRGGPNGGEMRGEVGKMVGEGDRDDSEGKKGDMGSKIGGRKREISLEEEGVRDGRSGVPGINLTLIKRNIGRANYFVGGGKPDSVCQAI